MKITAKSHPFLFEAFQAIDYDSGKALTRTAVITEYEVPERGYEMVLPAERALAALTADERETVAIGDQDEADNLYDVLGENGRRLQEILAEHFTDWCAGSNPVGV